MLMPVAFTRPSRLSPSSALQDGRHPASCPPGVELDQVYRIQAEVLQAFVHIFKDMVWRKAVIQAKFSPAGPFEILWRDLGGRV